MVPLTFCFCDFGRLWPYSTCYFQDVIGLKRGNMITLERPQKQPGGALLVSRKGHLGEYGKKKAGAPPCTVGSW